MGSMCPRCHRELDEDAICCADLQHTWKCGKCGKLSASFIVPYGRCYMCGGGVAVVEPYKTLDAEAARTVEEAVRFEVEMYQFYRLARRRASDETQKAVFEQLYLKEQDHLEELEMKYHTHLDPQLLETPPEAEPMLASWIFEGIDLAETSGSIRPLYEKAIEMERRTRDHFARRALELPAGPQREICRELAAEEEEHVAILESELWQFNAAASGGG
jgi:rubrerythrin